MSSTSAPPTTSTPTISTSHTWTHLVILPVLLGGSLPSLKQTTVSRRNHGGQTSHGETTFHIDGEGHEEEVAVPPETYAAIERYLRSVEEVWEPTLDVPALPQWGDPSAAFEQCTTQSQIRHLSLLSEHTGRVYTNGDEGREWPFTYCLYPNAQQYFNNGGVLPGPDDQPLKWEDYKDRMEWAVESAKNLDELDAVPEGTVKLAFTTDIVQPTRLKRISRPEGEDDTNSLQSWKILHPEISVKSRVQDDCPEWIRRDESAQASYDRSISAAIASSYQPSATVHLTPQTSVLEFLDDTSQNEHLLFDYAAHNVAEEVSFGVGGKYTDEDGEEIVDGLSVKAAWIDPDTFEVLRGEPPRNWQSQDSRRFEYEKDIERGLETMRKELAEGRSAGENTQPHPPPRSPVPRVTKNVPPNGGKASTKRHPRPLSPGFSPHLRPYTPIAEVVQAPEPAYPYQSIRSLHSPSRGTTRARLLRAVSFSDDDDTGGGSRASMQESLGLAVDSGQKGSRGKKGSLSSMGIALGMGLGIGLGQEKYRPWDRLVNDEMSDDTLSAPSSPVFHSPSPFDSPPSLSIPTTQNSSNSSTPVGHRAPPPSSFPAASFPHSRRQPEPSTSTATDSIGTASSQMSSSEGGRSKRRLIFRSPSLGSGSIKKGLMGKTKLRKVKRVEGGWDMVREGDWDTG
ncbi:hypothetical protein I350_07165 [Cryptococcus amylolentus CBS 6273]|uniref:Uncharacterized protein n=1 Tax=Cryptococcus amylolentus CBS 6273 TaxID=1296118 RepID=A0A1E3JDR2_9TREE|nr:hypothetical protein I350_07165 [Cryptococcus amylolentus CBS 6273]